MAEFLVLLIDQQILRAYFLCWTASPMDIARPFHFQLPKPSRNGESLDLKYNIFVSDSHLIKGRASTSRYSASYV
jgi:hypothetical protein